MFALVFGIVAIAVFYLYFNKKRNYWKIRNVPHRHPQLIFGHFLEFFLKPQLPAHYFKKLYDEFQGPYIGFLAFTNPVLIIKDLDIIKRVCVKDFNSFRDHSLIADEKIDPFFSNSLFGMTGDKWRILRSKLSPAFTPGKLKQMLPLINVCSENMVKYMEKNVEESTEVKSTVQRYTTDVIASCAFGINANSFEREDSEFNVISKKLLPPTLLQYLRFLTYFLVPSFVRLFKYRFTDFTANELLKDILNDIIRKREDGKYVRNDLVDIIINLKQQQEDIENTDGPGLVANAIEFFFAGLETASQLISFTIHALCVHPEIQERLRNEIEDCIAKHGGLTYEAINDMEYMNMVLSESLRKYTAFPFLHRVCNENYTIPKTGLEIEKETVILILPTAYHWDPKYFPNPELFDPERFNVKNKNNIVPYSYMPFGEGPRSCIGERLGLLISKMGIIHLIRNFEVKRNSLTTERFLYLSSSALANIKGGIQVTFSKIVK